MSFATIRTVDRTDGSVNDKDCQLTGGCSDKRGYSQVGGVVPIEVSGRRVAGALSGRMSSRVLAGFHPLRVGKQ